LEACRPATLLSNPGCGQPVGGDPVRSPEAGSPNKWPDWARETYRDPTVGLLTESVDIREAHIGGQCMVDELTGEVLKEGGQDMGKRALKRLNWKLLTEFLEATEVPPAISVPLTLHDCLEKCTTYSYPTGRWGYGN